MECQNSGGFDSPDCNNEGADNDRRRGGEPPVFPETIQDIYKVATVKIDSAVVVRLVNQEYTCEPNY